MENINIKRSNLNIGLIALFLIAFNSFVFISLDSMKAATGCQNLINCLSPTSSLNDERGNNKLRLEDYLIIVVASNGGHDAIENMLEGITGSIPPTVIVEHSGQSQKFAKIANNIEMIEYLNYDNQLLVQEKRFSLKLNEIILINLGIIEETEDGLLLNCNWHAIERYITEEYWQRPSDPQSQLPGDMLFRSAAKSCRKTIIAVVLSGHGLDGSLGANNVRAAGGVVISQSDPKSFGMPNSARGVKCAAKDIFPLINKIIKKRQEILLGTNPVYEGV